MSDRLIDALILLVLSLAPIVIAIIGGVIATNVHNYLLATSTLLAFVASALVLVATVLVSLLTIELIADKLI